MPMNNFIAFPPPLTKMFILCLSFVFQYIKSPQILCLSAFYDGNAQAAQGQSENKTRNKDLKTWLEVPKMCVSKSQRKKCDICK